MHGALGGAFSQSTRGKFSTGAMAGAMGEVLAPVLPSPPSVSAVTAAATLVTGGSRGDIQTAGQISGSVVENNFLAHSRAVDNMMLKRLESEGTISEGKAQELIEYNDEGRLKGLELSTDVMSVIASGGNPEGVVAKRMVLESIKSGTKKIGQFLSKKINKVEKLSEPVSGKVIDHMPVVGEVMNSGKVIEYVAPNLIKTQTQKSIALIRETPRVGLNSEGGIRGPGIKNGKVISGLENPRYLPGTATGGENLAEIKEGDRWFRGTERNMARIPGQIAEKMQGMEFKSFDQFRAKFWQNVAEDKVSFMKKSCNL